MRGLSPNTPEGGIFTFKPIDFISAETQDIEFGNSAMKTKSTAAG